MGVLPQIAEGVDVSIPTAGHVISAYALGVVVGAPVLAFFGARWPRRGLLVALMAAYGAFNLLSAVAPSYEVLFVARFLDGLPHGAYFGVASLVAASLAPPGRRGRAVASVMLGLSVANVAGVPAATWLGQHVGWRASYVAAALLSVLAVALIAVFVPSCPGHADATGPPGGAAVLPQRPGLAGPPRRGDRVRRAVRGLLLHRPHGHRGRWPAGVRGPRLRARLRPGHGRRHPARRRAGPLVGLRLADRGRRSARAWSWSLFWFAAPHGWALLPVVFMITLLGSVLVVNLQLRLMDVAGEAQTLGAAMNHASLNVANALGAWLGGLAIAAGYGYRSPALVGLALSVAGVAVLLVSWATSRSRGSAQGSSR